MPSLNDRFLPMFKNMRFETIVQICHVTQPVFMTLFPGFGITLRARERACALARPKMERI